MIKLVIFDFDGVFTNGSIYYSSNGFEFRSVNVKDTYALLLLKTNDIKCGIITRDTATLVEHINKIYERIDFYSTGIVDKAAEASKICNEMGIQLHNIAYIGDDIFDIPLLKIAGFSACPSDAHNDVKDCVDYICAHKGGKGCVREMVEHIISEQL